MKAIDTYAFRSCKVSRGSLINLAKEVEYTKLSKIPSKRGRQDSNRRGQTPRDEQCQKQFRIFHRKWTSGFEPVKINNN